MISKKYLIFSTVLDDHNAEIVYVSNTNPILWTKEIKDGKSFDSLDEAKSAIFDEADTFLGVVSGTSVDSISVISLSSGNIFTIINKNGDFIWYAK